MKQLKNFLKLASSEGRVADAVDLLEKVSAKDLRDISRRGFSKSIHKNT